jgi:peptidyl-prolyl cis-trans isomerase D
MAGESNDAIAKDAKLEWKTTGLLKRTDRSVDTAIIQEAFKLSHPVDNKPSYSSVAMTNGDFAVLEVSQVVDGDPTKFDAAQLQTLKRNIIGARGESDFASLLSSMKQKASIVIQQDNL